MSSRDIPLSLRLMLDHSEEAVSLARRKKRPDLDADRLLNLSLVRLLEIVGEAAKRVSPETRQHSPAIPWQQIISLRSRLIRGYDAVDFDILWQIVTADLPPLVEELKKILSADEK